MLVKTWTMSNVTAFEGGRQFPTQMKVIDQVKKGSTTTLVFGKQVPLPDEVEPIQGGA